MSDRKYRRDPSLLLNHLPTDKFASGRSGGPYSPNSKIREVLGAENPAKDDADSSIDSSINALASLNRSRDSGFFQEGASELLTSSLYFDNFSSKNRSREGQEKVKKRSTEVIDERNFERPKSMSNFEKWPPKNQYLQRADLAFTKQPIHSCGSKRGPKFGAEILPSSDHQENGLKKIPSISTSFQRRDSGAPSTNQVFNKVAEGFIHQNGNLSGLLDCCNSGEDDSSIRGIQIPVGGSNSSTIKKLQPATDCLDYSRETISVAVHAPGNGNYDYEADFSEGEGNIEEPSRSTVHRSPTVSSEKSSHLRSIGGTRVSQTSKTDFKNNSKAVNDDFKTSSKNSIPQERPFDMFGSKLSNICRQLLLSDYAPHVESSLTDMHFHCGGMEHQENTASQAINSLSFQSPNASSSVEQTDSLLIIDRARHIITSDEKMRSKHPKNNSTSLVGVKSTSPEFSLKVDTQPIWSMTPAHPETLENELSKKGDQVPLYCKFVRQVSKYDANHVESIEETRIRSKQTIDCEKKLPREKNGVVDAVPSDNHGPTNLSPYGGLASKTSKEPRKSTNEFIVNNNANPDDAKFSAEIKQTQTLESGRRSHSAKTYKTSKRFPRSPRDRSVSRRRREYLHEISLEIIKTIEEELRITHRWNGTSPSEAIARRLDRILSNHHQERVNLGLTEPSNQDLYNLLIDRIVLQDQEYFFHRSPRALPFRSLSPSSLVENLLREDQGFNLEKRLALLLRCGQIDGAEGKGRDFREDCDLSRVMETNASLQLPRLHLENSPRIGYEPAIYELSAQRSDSKSHSVDGASTSFSASTSNEISGGCLEATSNSLKKTNVLQTKIPLNDKVLEIVLNVSEHEPNLNSSGSPPSTSPVESLKKNFPDCPTPSKGDFKIPRGDGKNEVHLQSNGMVTNETERRDMKIEEENCFNPVQKDFILVATELEEPRASIEFKVLPPSSDLSNASGEILNLESCGKNIEARPTSEDLQEFNAKNDVVKNMKETDSTCKELSDNDAVFEAEISPQSVSLSNKSYLSLDLGNKSKNFSPRRIKIMLSSSSDAGGNCSVVTPPPHSISENKFESLGREECLVRGGNLSHNSSNNSSSNNNNITNNDSSNNNTRASRQNLSSSDDLIFGAGSAKMNEKNADKMKIRKRVTFNRDLVISPSDLTGVRKFSSDKTILVNKESHASSTSSDAKGKTDESNESADSLNPNRVILVNKFLDFTGNGPKETTIFQTHPLQDNSNSLNSKDLSRSKEVSLGIPTSLKLETIDSSMTDDKRSTEAKESLDSLQLMMSGGEPSEIDPRQTRQKYSLSRTFTSSPTPPRLLRKLNAVRVTDFGAARGVLRKAFKDRAFGKAFDDHDMAALRCKTSYDMSKRKQRRTRNEVPEKERILANVEVQTELNVAYKEPQNSVPGSSRFNQVQSWFRESSFSFLAKLGLAIFAFVMALTVFYFIGDCSNISSLTFDGRKSPLSAAFSME